MDDFFTSQVADTDEAVARVDDAGAFAVELARLVENASYRITVAREEAVPRDAVV